MSLGRRHPAGEERESPWGGGPPPHSKPSPRSHPWISTMSGCRKLYPFVFQMKKPRLRGFKQLALKCPAPTCLPGKYPLVSSASTPVSPPLWSFPCGLSLLQSGLRSLALICLRFVSFICPLKSRTESLYLHVLWSWQRTWSVLSAQLTLTKTWNCSG